MFMNFNMDTETVIVEIKLGDSIIKKQKMSYHEDIIKSKYISLVNQISELKEPYKVTMYTDVYIDENKTLKNYMSFGNKAYLNAFPNEFK